jgi:hypothetical protein
VLALFRTPQLMRRTAGLSPLNSSSVASLKFMYALHFAHYNNVRVHKTLRVAPARAANVTDRLWPLEELVEKTSN